MNIPRYKNLYVHIWVLREVWRFDAKKPTKKLEEKSAVIPEVCPIERSMYSTRLVILHWLQEFEYQRSYSPCVISCYADLTLEADFWMKVTINRPSIHIIKFQNVPSLHIINVQNVPSGMHGRRKKKVVTTDSNTFTVSVINYFECTDWRCVAFMTGSYKNYLEGSVSCRWFEPHVKGGRALWKIIKLVNIETIMVKSSVSC